jgi:TRAP-type C4-dicarboxylate transport system substrate-binding protein
LIFWHFPLLTAASFKKAKTSRHTATENAVKQVLTNYQAMTFRTRNFLNGHLCLMESIAIRFSHVVSSDAPKGKAALKFAELVAERTSGRVRVDVFPNSRLFGDNDEMVSLLAGHVEMLAPSPSKFKVLHTKDFEVFDLPYLFSDLAAVHRVTEG